MILRRLKVWQWNRRDSRSGVECMPLRDAVVQSFAACSATRNHDYVDDRSLELSGWNSGMRGSRLAAARERTMAWCTVDDR